MSIKKAAAGLLMAAFATATTLPAATPALAQQGGASTAAEQSAMEYSRQLHLAYVASPSLMVNDEVREGLENLSYTLNQRTSMAPAGVVEVNIEEDDISFFPFIYWPVTEGSDELSPAAQQRVQSYLQNGGMILFDTRDQGMNRNVNAVLEGLLAGINIRPVTRLGAEHALNQSFYLVQNAPGTSADTPVWVEDRGQRGGEVVSSVIIGGNNWAGAWAGSTVAPQSRQYEMALRSGINMVTYALTGNYKEDMIYMPSILERMRNEP